MSKRRSLSESDLGRLDICRVKEEVSDSCLSRGVKTADLVVERHVYGSSSTA